MNAAQLADEVRARKGARVVTLLRHITEQESELYDFAADGWLLRCEVVRQTEERTWTEERIAPEMLADRTVAKSYRAALRRHMSATRLRP
jgi:hypothetical protein